VNQFSLTIDFCGSQNGIAYKLQITTLTKTKSNHNFNKNKIYPKISKLARI